MRTLGFATGLVAACAVTQSAWATDVRDFSGLGTQQIGRAGAWVARATTPLATFDNPAGLAGQRTGASADVAVVANSVCFTRAGDGSQLDSGGVGVPYPEVCNDKKLEPLPAIAGVLHVMDTLGIGLSVAPPSLYGGIKFPDTVTGKNRFGVQTELPSPGRYILLESGGVYLNTTLSAGFEAAPGLRVGAGFIWGLANLKLANANMALSPTPQTDGTWLDPWGSDVRAEIDVSDMFIPGVVVGALYSPIDMLDVGLTVTAQEAFDEHGQLTTRANYWSSTGGLFKNPTVTNSDDIEADLAHFRLPNPLDVRLGARFHMPRVGGDIQLGQERDPIADDVFDVELDLSYTRNSAYRAAELRFPARPVIEVQGTGGQVPQDADVDFNVKGDTLGARLGGDFVVLPNRVAVRAGAFYEPDVQRPEYLNVAFLASRRIGLAGGVQVRLAFVDVEASYMHVFFDDVDNGGNGRLRVVSGDVSAQPVPNRSPYGINGGKVTQSVNIVSLGARARF